MNLPVATIRLVDKNEALAEVCLNGFEAVKQPEQWGTSALARLIWKFQMIEGDELKLQRFSKRGEPVLLVTPQGKEVLVHIVETPSDQCNYGLIEYVM